MNYRVVKQFSNSAVDNFYNFFYKIVDFGKITVDFLYSFYEIWEAFFLIFYNIFMFIYYLLLFGIDKSTESRSTIFFWRKLPMRQAYKPSSVFVRESYSHNPIPSMYGKEAAAKVSDVGNAIGSAAKEGVTTTVKKMRSLPSGARLEVGKKILEFFVTFGQTLKAIFVTPFVKIAEFFANRLKPVREEEDRGRSLIDEYMKEYERKRKA